MTYLPPSNKNKDLDLFTMHMREMEKLKKYMTPLEKKCLIDDMYKPIYHKKIDLESYFRQEESCWVSKYLLHRVRQRYESMKNSGKVFKKE